MAERDISATSISDMTNIVKDYSVETKQTDGVSDQEETTWQNDKWSQQLGYYKKIPELKKAIDALAIWVLGKGYDADSEITVELDNIKGWGEDTFSSIMWNMIVTKKISGDAYAEIVRDVETGKLINIKPLDPGSIKIIVDRKGIIKRYEQVNKVKGNQRKFKPNQILHLCNDRIADEIHGTSVIDACEAVILMRNEAMTDYKTILHRNINPLKIVEVDTDDPVKITAHRANWEKMTKDKEVIFIPLGSAKVTIPPVVLQDPSTWIKYLENFFYQAVGVPKIILGGSEEFTEASSKIAYLTFEQVYAKEQSELEADLWNQIYVRLKYKRPASLMNELLSSDEKNQSQTGFQPNDVMAGVGK